AFPGGGLPGLQLVDSSMEMRVARNKKCNGLCQFELTNQIRSAGVASPRQWQAHFRFCSAARGGVRPEVSEFLTAEGVWEAIHSWDVHALAELSGELGRGQKEICLR